MANKLILKRSSVAAKIPLAADLEVGEIAVNLADQKLYSKDAAGTVIIVGQGASGFPAGTVMLFSQTSAPTGWTKDSTNYNDYALRVTTGTVASGGTVGFTTAFASYTPAGSISINTSGLSAGATTLTTAQMPSHTHSAGTGLIGGGALGNAGGYGQLTVGYGATSSTGGNGSHSHAMSGSATGTFTGTARDFAVKYLDIIRATKG